MNSIGSAIVWAALQITVIGGFTAALYFVARQFGPRLGVTTALCGLCLMATTAALAFSPYPRWSASLPSTFQTRATTKSSDAGLATEVAVHSPPREDNSWLSIAREIWLAEMATTEASDDAAEGSATVGTNAVRSWRWTGAVAVLSILTFVFGVSRFLLGIATARQYRVDSEVLNEGRISNTLDILKSRLGYRKAVDVHEHRSLFSAATIGWLRPMILLPSDWRSWSDEDLQAVLAHELAHIHHRDFLGWMFAQVFVAVQCFHPLAHWLSGRLRLEQELAADSVAAEIAGGQDAYLTSLAGLALKLANHRVSWSAQAFLPTRRSFLRRIEMLRDKPRIVTRGHRRLQPIIVGTLMLVGIIVVGWRRPEIVPLAQSAIAAEFGAPTSNEGGVEGVDLSFVPHDAVLVAAIRPSRMLRRPELGRLAKMLADSKPNPRPSQLDFVRLTVLSSTGPKGGAASPGIMLRFNKATDFINDENTTDAGEFINFAIRRTDGGSFAAKVDDHTVLISEDLATLRRMLIAQPDSAEGQVWVADWKKHATKDAVACLNLRQMKPLLQMMKDNTKGPEASILGIVGPVWKQSQFAVVGITVNSQLDGLLEVQADSPTAAKSVMETLGAAITLCKNFLSNARNGTGSGSDLAMAQFAMVVQPLLDSLQISQSGTRVSAKAAQSSEEVDKIVGGVVAPAVMAARAAARRTQDINSARQIMLAMLNYEAANGHFPAARVLGPDGKTEHSWRVAILPYLELVGANLYDEYRLDQPWDSPQNMKVLAKMPSVFRSAMAPAQSTNSCFYVLNGPEAAFDGNTERRLRDIVDGTSKTIFVVGVRGDTPWTKPDDIPFDLNADQLELNGFHREGFIAATGDGSVRFISNGVEEATLKKMITYRGRERSGF